MTSGPKLRHLLVSSLLAAAVLSTGCAQEEVQVSIDPASATVSAGESVVFIAQVKGADDPSVTWSVPAGDAAGTISASGVYTAPLVAGSYEVQATSVADPTRSVTATVTVTPPTSVAITVSPNPVSVQTGARQTFSATVTGTDDHHVTWRLQEGLAGGSVNSDGTYTAPSTAGTFHVEAVSVADSRAKGAATVTVTTSAVASVSLSPVNPTAVSGQFLPFEATAYGVRYSTALQWSVIEPQGGGVTGHGLYLAPRGTGVFHVTVAPQSDSAKRAQTAVEVQAPTGISVWVAPRAPTVPSGGQQSFSASVSGAADTSVTWSVRELAGGTISPEGVYTVPQLPGNTPLGSYTIVATSNADPTKRAEIPVLVTSQPVYSLVINPGTVSLSPGASKAFTATATSGVTYGPEVGYTPALIWRVLESGGGTISSNGNYTAPATPGVYHVAAESTATPDTFATVKVE